jgi:outer membrane protein
MVKRLVSAGGSPGLVIVRLVTVFLILGTPVGAQTLAPAAQHLTLKDAEQRAVQNHPEVRAGEYNALAAGETLREVRSAYLPTVYANFTGAQALPGTAIAAGGLNSSSVLDRFSYGFTASQLLTDFGRTSSLSASASLRVDAGEQDVAARRADVLLRVDRAYFDALRAQSIMRVAEQTVATRQAAVDQASALASTGLKSTLDVSFAKVNLGEAQLLLLQSKNDLQASYARLSAALGTSQAATYDLADEPMPAAPPADSAMLITQAMHDRPDLARERITQQSDTTFATAERNLWMPSVSLIGVGGLTPYHQIGLSDRYSAIGLNVSVPVTTGTSFAARRAEANFRASAQQQAVNDLQNQVARDVQVAWLDAQTAYQKLDLTNQLLAETTDAMDLAQQRYDLGLSSIVELTQAQLNQTSAQIEQATARFDYQARNAALQYQIGALK